jgi:RES domain-containing protein
MLVWRIAQSKWALDKRCAGARNEGGRWNPVGMAPLYAGTNVEICALEMFAHLAGVDHPPLKLVAIAIPDKPRMCYTPAIKDLPVGWSALPVSAASQEFGGRWLAEVGQLVMLVPSVLVPEARNAVINPMHPDYQHVSLKVVREFTFDSRMFK